MKTTRQSGATGREDAHVIKYHPLVYSGVGITTLGVLAILLAPPLVLTAVAFGIAFVASAWTLVAVVGLLTVIVGAFLTKPCDSF